MYASFLIEPPDQLFRRIVPKILKQHVTCDKVKEDNPNTQVILYIRVSSRVRVNSDGESRKIS